MSSMKALVKKEATPGLWLEDVPIPKVGVNDVRLPSMQSLFHLDHRLLGVSPRAISVLLLWKVRFEDRFEHQHRCCHAHPISQGRDGQRELHKCSTSIWDWLRFVTRSIPSGANAFPF